MLNLALHFPGRRRYRHWIQMRFFLPVSIMYGALRCVRLVNLMITSGILMKRLFPRSSTDRFSRSASSSGRPVKSFSMICKLYSFRQCLMVDGSSSMWLKPRPKSTCIQYKEKKMSQLMRLWYLLHRRPAKAQASLRIHAVSPEPSLFAHIKYGSKRRAWPKIRHLAPLDGCACTFEEWVYGGRKVP